MLWILKANPLRGGDDPWKPWYDKAFGFVVRAPTELAARQMAAEDAGDEGKDAWLDEELSTCIELEADGDAAVVLQDFHAA